MEKVALDYVPDNFPAVEGTNVTSLDKGFLEAKWVLTVVSLSTKHRSSIIDQTEANPLWASRRCYRVRVGHTKIDLFAKKARTHVLMS